MIIKRLNKGRFYKNGGPFSTGHYEFLPSNQLMMDIDRLTVDAQLSVSRAEGMFVEYGYFFQTSTVVFKAVFSLKHKKAMTATVHGKGVFNFLGDIQNKVTKAMADLLKARLFLVFHDENEGPPFEIYEITQQGDAVYRATVPAQTKEAWTDAWRSLGLLAA